VLLGTGERPGPWSIAGGAVVLGAVALRTLVKQ
jgi:drug/metabolite transporter (DMT)-like permease